MESKAKRCSVRVRVRECGAVPGLYQSGRYRMLLTSQKTKDGRAWGGEGRRMTGWGRERKLCESECLTLQPSYPHRPPTGAFWARVSRFQS